MFKIQEINHAVLVLVKPREEHIGLLVESDEPVDFEHVLQVFLRDFVEALQVQKLESLGEVEGRSLVQLHFHLLYVVFYLNYSLKQHSYLFPSLFRYLIANLVVKRQSGIELPGECLIPRPEHVLHISVRQVAISVRVKSFHQQFRLRLSQIDVEKCKSLKSIV